MKNAKHRLKIKKVRVKKHKTPKQRRTDKAMQCLKGVIISWSVKDPIQDDREIINNRIEHRNPSMRVMLPTITQNMAGITKVNLKWNLLIKMEFKGKEYDESEIVYRGKMDDMSKVHRDTVKEMQEEFDEHQKENYMITHLRAEILGNKEVTEIDYNIEV